MNRGWEGWSCVPGYPRPSSFSSKLPHYCPCNARSLPSGRVLCFFRFTYPKIKVMFCSSLWAPWVQDHACWVITGSKLGTWEAINKPFLNVLMKEKSHQDNRKIVLCPPHHAGFTGVQSSQSWANFECTSPIQFFQRLLFAELPSEPPDGASSAFIRQFFLGSRMFYHKANLWLLLSWPQRQIGPHRLPPNWNFGEIPLISLLGNFRLLPSKCPKMRNVLSKDEPTGAEALLQVLLPCDHHRVHSTSHCRMHNY